MTVAELIAKLQTMPQDVTIIISERNCTTNKVFNVYATPTQVYIDSLHDGSPSVHGRL